MMHWGLNQVFIFDNKSVRAYNTNMLNKKVNSVTLINTPSGYLWAEQGKVYKTLKGAKIGISHDAKILAKRGVRTYTFLTIKG